MDTKEIRCPSGMRGRIRKLLGRDFHTTLTDDNDEATPDVMAGLAESVWVETTDPGPYRFESGAPPFRTDVLIGDRSHILIASRIFTDGGKKPNRIQCPGCETWFPEIFDYSELKTREWPDGDAPEPVDDEMALKAYNARRQFAAGAPCSTLMPDETTIRWNLFTGALLTGGIRKYSLQFGGGVYAEMSARIHSIDGLDLDSLDKPADRRVAVFDKVTGYTDTEFWALWDDVQDHECGPETDVKKQCPSPTCGHKFGYQTDTMGFIIPAPRMRSMRSRAGAQRRTTM